MKKFFIYLFALVIAMPCSIASAASVSNATVFVAAKKADSLKRKKKKKGGKKKKGPKKSAMM